MQIVPTLFAALMGLFWVVLAIITLLMIFDTKTPKRVVVLAVLLQFCVAGMVINDAILGRYGSLDGLF